MNTTIARSALLASFILSGVLSAPSLVADTAIYDLSTIVTTSGDGQNTWSAPTNVANSGGVEGTLATSGQKLTYNWTVANETGTQNTYFVGKFADAVSLTNVGDKITLNFTVTGANLATGAQAFRFGLFNIGNAAATSHYQAATGYRADYGPDTNGNNGIRYRQNTDSLNSNLYASAISPRIDGQTNSDYTWKSLTTASGLLEIELLADGKVRITSSFGGSAQASITSSNLYTTFNAISFFAVGTSAARNGSLTFGDLKVIHTTATAIPEPATVSLCLAAAIALGALALRRQG